MKKVFITGITGYIGSNLARALAGSFEVCGLVRFPLNDRYLSDIKNNITFYPYDGTYHRMDEALLKCKPDIVFHLATYFVNNHNETQIDNLVSSNILMGIHLLEAMCKNKVANLVNTVTVAQHFNGKSYNPANLYAATKQGFQDIVEFYVQAKKLSAVHLCLTDTYGPRDFRPKILNVVKRAALEKTTIDMTAGEQEFDVVYIDDVVSAFTIAGEVLERMPDGTSATYSISGGKPVPLRSVVEQFAQINNCEIKINWGARPYSDREEMKVCQPDNLLPGWRPEVSLQDGLRGFFQS